MVKKSRVKKKKAANDLQGHLRVRIDKKELTIFKTKSDRITGKPYQILIREIISAFNDDRLRIVKTDGQKGSDLYISRERARTRATPRPERAISEA